MGSWNSTCQLTGFPISWSDPVVEVAILPSETNDTFHRESVLPSLGGGYCSQGPEFMVLDFPVFGIYNDCGGIEIQDDPVYLRAFEKLFLHGRERWAEEGASAQQFFDLAERDPETNSRDKWMICLAHRWAWDWVVEQNLSETGSWPLQRLEEKVPEVREFAERLFQGEKWSESYFIRDNPNLYDDTLTFVYGLRWVLCDIKNKAASEEALRAVLDRHIQISKVSHWMRASHLMWQPRLSGSQTSHYPEELEFRKKFLQVQIDKIDELVEKNHRENGCEDESCEKCAEWFPEEEEEEE